MSVLLHAVPLAGVCRKERSSAVPPVRAGPEEMRCVGSKRTPEMGRDMLLAASIVNSRDRRRMGEIALCTPSHRISSGYTPPASLIPTPYSYARECVLVCRRYDPC